jgi:hypothetical protein
MFTHKRPGLAEHIRLCWDEPGKALTEGSRFQPEVRPDWLEVQIDMVRYVCLISSRRANLISHRVDGNSPSA